MFAHHEKIESHPSPNMNTDKFIRNFVCAKDRLIEAQNIMPIVTGINFLRPKVSDIDPSRNAPTAIPINVSETRNINTIKMQQT